jgi:ubiquinone/menaquinone biosynthesis C-methylase UbiE
MAEAIEQRVQQYLLDGADEDLKRLLAISELMAATSRTAIRRSGIQPGWNVIECGCGPVGALIVMAEMVGSAGRVVGVDSSPPTIQRARSLVDTLGLSSVEVVIGDINELDAGALGAPFDVAFSRLFLMHQADPVHTLRRIAGLLRPGGWAIAQEPLRAPPPRSFPHVPALDAYWELLHQSMEGFGAQAQAVEQLSRSAVAAGLEVVSLDGSFAVASPDRMFAIHAATLAAARERATTAGLATEDAIDGLIGELRAAAAGRYEWVSSPFFLDITMRKPTAASL